MVHNRQAEQIAAQDGRVGTETSVAVVQLAMLVVAVAALLLQALDIHHVVVHSHIQCEDDWKLRHTAA